MSIPRVYSAIHSVAAELATKGVPKRFVNLEDHYAYRSIDDVYAAVAPLLAAHRLCVLPRVLERVAAFCDGNNNEILASVCVRMAIDLVSVEDGSTHTIETFGEALDPSDKATAKALQSAYKYALVQAFCIPVPAEDADAFSPRLKSQEHTPEPVQSWTQWAIDICDMIKGCQSIEAVSRVQKSNRPLLLALSREKPELYLKVGESFAERRKALTAKPAASAPRARKQAAKRKTEQPEVVNA